MNAAAIKVHLAYTHVCRADGAGFTLASQRTAAQRRPNDFGNGF